MFAADKAANQAILEEINYLVNINFALFFGIICLLFIV